MRLTETHEKILLILISLHSFIVGLMLMFAAPWAIQFAGWEGADPIFFIWQAYNARCRFNRNRQGTSASVKGIFNGFLVNFTNGFAIDF